MTTVRWLRVHALVASLVMLTSCVNVDALHPVDVLQEKAPDSSVLLFSTSCESQSLGYAVALTLYHVNDDATLGPVPGDKAAWAYFLDGTAKPIDIPSPTHVGIDWRALPAGKYVMVVGLSNPHEQLHAAPEYYFTVTPGQVLYLGEFYKTGHQLELQGSYSRDVGYFRDHVNTAKGVDVVPAVVTIKNVEYPQKLKIPLVDNLVFTSLADPHGTAAGARFEVPR